MTADTTPSGNLTELRSCLGRFATGVTVVTCTDSAGHPCGITANSFSSVSLEPPLVLWNVAKVSNSLQAYLDAEFFAINILREQQQDISSHFARTDHTRFDGIAYALSADGAPVLADTLACLHCRTRQIHDCGDHHIIIGAIRRFEINEGKPLLFYAGDYASLA